MNTTLSNRYYVKALECYPFNLEVVLESLDYALSYDEDHVQALCLMGRFHMEILLDYLMAEHYFTRALRSDLNYPGTYGPFALLKIKKEDYVGAMKLINYGMKVQGVEKGRLLLIKASIYESRSQLCWTNCLIDSKRKSKASL